jgi:mannitol-1-/sugar-/sorbitol-6-phosphatase
MNSATGSRAVLFDVDGTPIDEASNQRRIWASWAREFGVDPNTTYEVALRTRPSETFAIVVPRHDPARCLQLLHQLEDQDAVTGNYAAFDRAATLLRRLQDPSWALVTSNCAHRVRIRFARTDLPEPPLIIDSETVSHGKPDPQGYPLAARALGVDPRGCLVIEGSPAGVAAARAAGATVWVVNAATPMSGADRTYPTLNDAVSGVLEFANNIGPQSSNQSPELRPAVSDDDPLRTPGRLRGPMGRAREMPMSVLSRDRLTWSQDEPRR